MRISVAKPLPTLPGFCSHSRPLITVTPVNSVAAHSSFTFSGPRRSIQPRLTRLDMAPPDARDCARWKDPPSPSSCCAACAASWLARGLKPSAGASLCGQARACIELLVEHGAATDEQDALRHQDAKFEGLRTRNSSQAGQPSDDCGQRVKRG